MAIGASIAPARRIQRIDVERLGLSTLVVALLLIAFAFEAYRLASPSDGTEVAGPGNPFGPGGVAVEPLGAAAAGLLAPGDRVTAVFDRSVDAWADELVDPYASRPVIAHGDPLTYAIERDGRSMEIT